MRLPVARTVRDFPQSKCPRSLPRRPPAWLPPQGPRLPRRPLRRLPVIEDDHLSSAVDLSWLKCIAAGPTLLDPRRRFAGDGRCDPGQRRRWCSRSSPPCSARSSTPCARAQASSWKSSCSGSSSPCSSAPGPGRRFAQSSGNRLKTGQTGCRLKTGQGTARRTGKTSTREVRRLTSPRGGCGSCGART